MDADETPVGLRITSAGLAALSALSHSRQNTRLRRTPRHEHGRTASASARSFQPGSKLGQLVDLPSGPEPVSIDVLVAAIAWQPHTVRATLTRLRQRSLTLQTGKAEGSKTGYRIALAAEPSFPGKADATGAEV